VAGNIRPHVNHVSAESIRTLTFWNICRTA
jgi:hypothetical protein